MELWCNIPGENLDVLSFLEKNRWKPYLKKGCIMVGLQNKDIIHNFPASSTFFIKLWEYGGGMTKTGYGCIICGSNGEKLKPFKIRTTGELSNKIHAEFHIKYGCVINCTKHGACSIDYVQIQLIHDSINIFTKHVWKGNNADLPNIHQQYKEAVNAAYKKANHFHCREPHYIQE